MIDLEEGEGQGELVSVKLNLERSKTVSVLTSEVPYLELDVLVLDCLYVEPDR